MDKNCPQTVRSRVEAVRVNQRRDGVSPVVASMYCSPHPAALHIAPAARLRGFASMIPRPENCFAKMMADSRARLVYDGDGQQ